MSSKVSGEDLLHVLNTPPEIIFAEGDNTSIFNNIRIKFHWTKRNTNIFYFIFLSKFFDLIYRNWTLYPTMTYEITFE